MAKSKPAAGAAATAAFKPHHSLHETVLNLIRDCKHKDVEHIVDSVYGRIKTQLFAGEQVKFTVDSKVITGEVVSVDQKPSTPVKSVTKSVKHSSPSSDKENDFAPSGPSGSIKYSVKVDSRIVSGIPADILKRVEHLPSRSDIKNLIVDTVKDVEDSDDLVVLDSQTAPKNQKRKTASSVSGGASKKAKTDKKKTTPCSQKNTLDAFVNARKPCTEDCTVLKQGCEELSSPIVCDEPVQNTTKSIVTRRRTPQKIKLDKPVEEKKKRNTRKKNSEKEVVDSSSMKGKAKLENSTASKKKKVCDDKVIDLTSSSPVMKITKEKATPGINQQSVTCTITISPKNKQAATASKKIISNDKQTCSKQLIVTSSCNQTSNKQPMIITSGKQTSNKQPIVITSDKQPPGKQSMVITNSKQTSGKQPQILILAPFKQENSGTTTITKSPVTLVVNRLSSDNKIVSAKPKFIIEAKSQEKLANEKSSNFKQMTLFDLARLKSPDGSSDDKFARIIPGTPKIVRKYKKALKEDNDKLQKHCVLVAAKEMSDEQQASLPSPMKHLVLAKVQVLKMRETMKTMSSEERALYLKERSKNLRMPQVTARMEDTTLLVTRPLPLPEPVTLPDCLPLHCFSDLMLVSQFISSCWGYITADTDNLKCREVTLERLTQNLVEKNTELQGILISLLQTLLKDYTLNEAYVIGTLLRDIAINEDTFSNLLYLTLVMTSEKEGRFVEEKLRLTVLAERISSVDVMELESEEILDYLVVLCDLILDCQGLIDYQADVQQKLTKIWKDRSTFMKEYYSQMCETNTLLESIKPLQSTNDSKEGNDNSQSTLLSLAETVKSRQETSKKLAEEREKKHEAEKKLKSAQAEREKLDNSKKAYDDQIKKLQAKLEGSYRLNPLGMDRDYNRYWRFPGHAGIFVEKGWFDENYLYNVPPIEVEENVQNDIDERQSTPLIVSHRWYYYGDKSSIDNLIGSLSKTGLREGALCDRLQKEYADITAQLNSKSSDSEPKRQDTKKASCNESTDTREDKFKKMLLDLEDRIRSGGLGGVADYDEWNNDLSNADSIESLASCMLKCQESVYPNRLCGIMSSKMSKSTSLDEPNSDDQADDEETITLSQHFIKWKESVSHCVSVSSLFVLLEIFEMSVMWQKSIDYIKCRVCKRSGDDSLMLLCDGCDLGFHIPCLRMKKRDIPEGDWFCPTCKPSEPRSTRTTASMKELSESEDEDDEDDDDESSEDEEEVCTVCSKAGGNMVLCDTCLLGYHIVCHEPPLRAVPRLAWTCHSCRFGTETKIWKKPAESNSSTKKSGGQKQAAALCKTAAVKSTELKNPSKPKHRQQQPEQDSNTRRKKSSLGKTADVKPADVKTADRSSLRRRNQPRVCNDEDAEYQSGSSSDDEIILNLSQEQKTIAARLSPKKTEEKSKRGRKAETINMSPQKLRKMLKTLHTKLWNHKSSWPFEYPVEKDEVPDYYDVIRNPMDLTTIQKKLDQYITAEEFVADVKQMVFNAYDYNKRDSAVAKTTVIFEDFFAKTLSKHFAAVKYSKQHGMFDCKPK